MSECFPDRSNVLVYFSLNINHFLFFLLVTVKNVILYFFNFLSRFVKFFCCLTHPNIHPFRRLNSTWNCRLIQNIFFHHCSNALLCFSFSFQQRFWMIWCTVRLFAWMPNRPGETTMMSTACMATLWCWPLKSECIYNQWQEQYG